MARLVPVAALVLFAGTAPAAPLDAIPKQANLVIAVEKPRALAEAVRDAAGYRNVGAAVPAVRELLDSTPVRRFFQLVAFAEKDTGFAWPDLIDRAAGNGVVIAAATGTDPAPALTVVRGTDEKASAAVFALLLRVIEDERARQAGPGAKAALRRQSYHGIEAVAAGDDFFAARVGTNLYLANHEAALTAGLDLALARKDGDSLADRPGPATAKKLVGGDPLLWLWFDLAAAKETKASKDFFANTRKDTFQTLVAGGTIDAVRRAEFVAAGLFRTADGFAATVRLPASRTDLAKELALHAPPPGTPATLPLLEPPGVVYSQSFYLDLASWWRDRKSVVNEQQLKDLEKFDREASRFLPGTSVGKLLEQSGPYHRIVVAHRDEKPYSVEPVQPVPPFAVVSSFRDPAFGKSAAATLRAAGLIASFQLKWTSAESVEDGVPIVSYRFPEKSPNPDGGIENYRANFVPSFAVVGDFLVVASRPGLIKDLIPELKKPADPSNGSAAVWRGRAYANGVADLLRAYPDQTITTTVLTEGVGLGQARQQVEALVGWLRTLGTYDVTVDHGREAFEVRVEWKGGN